MQWVHLLREHHWPGPTFTARDLYPAEGRNVITSGALARDDWTHFLWVDSDHLPGMKCLERLAEYPDDVSCVVGAYFGREYPYDLQAWNSDPESEGLKQIHPALIDSMLATPDLYRVGGGGTGWMLIRRNVLELMQEEKGEGNTWEVKGLGPELKRKLGIGLVLGEDVMFCVEIARLFGVQTWLDTDPRIESAHQGTLRVTRQEWRAAHFVELGGAVSLDTQAINRTGHVLERDERGMNRAQRRALAHNRTSG